MKVQDLRKGNYVERSDIVSSKPRHEQVLEIYVRVSTTGAFKTVCDYKDIAPIPLTEDWLERFGFIRFKGWDGMDFWILEKDKSTYERFEILETEQGYELRSCQICEYVHILQNAYYFHELTGEELTIKD